MREQYPFFREEDERTRAVIGEDAAESDLNGEYQKPYAILTQKRLYCKNETGNYITPSADLLKAENGLLPGPNWFLWSAIIGVALAVGLINWTFWIIYSNDPFMWEIWTYNEGFPTLVWMAERVFLCGGSVMTIILILVKKFQAVNKLILIIAFIEVVCNAIWFWLFPWINSFILCCAVSVVLSTSSVILSILGIIQDKRHTAFFITHSAGAFSFNPGLYSSAELKHFAAQVKALKAGDTNGQ